MGSAGNAALTAARRRVLLRRQLATTPGRLRLAATMIALAAIAFGIVAAHAADTRRQAVRDVATNGGLLVKSVDLSARLSDAHAIAASSFLAGGPEPGRAHLAYDDELRVASDRLAELAGEIERSSRGGRAVGVITRRLPEYSSLVASARANYRLGHPIGAAYLRAASATLRDAPGGMLPSARTLYEIQATKLTASYHDGVSTATLLAVLLAGCVLLVVLAATQAYLTRATRRLVNVRLALATTLTVGLVAWMTVAFALQRGDLVQAQRSGSDPVELLTAARILASRAQANESIALSARGSGEGEPNLADVDRGFLAVVTPVRGLLEQARSGADATSDATASRVAVATIVRAYARYRAAHDRVVGAQRDGDFTQAVRLAVQSRLGEPSTKDTAERLNSALDQGIAIAQEDFARRAADALSALDGLAPAIALLTVLAALLALSGVRERLEEYR
jgi:hypothetical protein